MSSSSSTPSADPPRKPRRRWFQFSLRTMLVMMLVCGGLLGWIGAERRKNAEGEACLKTLRELGAEVAEDKKSPKHSSWSKLVWGDNAFHRVAGVGLTAKRFSDAEIKYLEGLPNLRILYLVNAPITDAGLENIARLTNLKFLYFRNTAITDTGLKHLSGMSQLLRLDLRSTKITDAGLHELKKQLPNCKIVYSNAEPSDDDDPFK